MTRDHRQAIPMVGTAAPNGTAVRTSTHQATRRRTTLRARSTQNLRIQPWRGRLDTVLVSRRWRNRPIRPKDLEVIFERLPNIGVRGLITGALRPDEEQVFVDAGFMPCQRLELLRWSNPTDNGAHQRLQPRYKPRRSRPISDDCGGADFRLESVRRGSTTAILGVDASAFDPFWALDAAALKEACQATPSNHLRVVVEQFRGGPRGKTAVGYSAFGLAGTSGYLQRLAVDPAVRRQGLATALVDDGLKWLADRGAHSCLVNTPADNATALNLYRGCGFVSEPHGLTVYYRSLSPGPAETGNTPPGADEMQRHIMAEHLTSADEPSTNFQRQTGDWARGPS